MSRGSRCTPVLEVLEHGVLERRGRPGGAQLRAHIGPWVRAGIGPAEALGILFPHVSRDAERGAVGLPAGGGWDRAAGGEGEPRGDGRVGRSWVVGHALSPGLSPDGVARDRAALLGRSTPLEVRQTRDHASDSGGRDIDRRGSSRVVHKTAGPVVGWRAMVGCHGQALVHLRRAAEPNRGWPISTQAEIQSKTGKNGSPAGGSAKDSFQGDPESSKRGGGGLCFSLCFSHLSLSIKAGRGGRLAFSSPLAVARLNSHLRGQRKTE